MAVIAHNEAEVELLARLMRAEAEGDGPLGMLMVGNVGVNRVLGDCLDFGDARTLQQMVFHANRRLSSSMVRSMEHRSLQVTLFLLSTRK